MKYKIVVEKIEENEYVACCPLLQHFHASGESLNDALLNLRQELLCYLHDAAAEFEIVMRHEGKTHGIDAGQAL